MVAHSADAPGGSIAPTSCAITIDAGSGFSPEPLRGSSDKLRIAISSALVSDVPGGACVGDHIVIPAAASLGIESDTGSLPKLAENEMAAESNAFEGPRLPSKWARFYWFLIHFWRWLIGLLSQKKKKKTAAESGITGILQETARLDGIEEDNCVVTADSPRQPNSIHNEGGDQDDPNLNADAAGQEDPPEARNHRAGDVQIAPVYDTVLQFLRETVVEMKNLWEQYPANLTFFTKLKRLVRFYKQYSKDKAKDSKLQEAHLRLELEKAQLSLQQQCNAKIWP